MCWRRRFTRWMRASVAGADKPFHIRDMGRRLHTRIVPQFRKYDISFISLISPSLRFCWFGTACYPVADPSEHCTSSDPTAF
jgi:hypothetical protein